MLKKTVEQGVLSSLLAQATNVMNGFMINDPTTPDLVANVALPPMGFLKYAVQGMTTSPKNTNEKRALNCHIIVGSCTNAIQNSLKTPLQRWAATSVLSVVPSAGVEMNAYYDRRSLRFFYYNHNGKNTYFSDSADIVAHELGHAVLDAMRPDFWSVQALEIWSFHEAFSDIVALFNVMNYDAVISKVLKETNGRLAASNSASRLAEEVGLLLRSVTKNPSYLPNALRDPAVETFRYVNPAGLPADGPNNKLAAECHSFGRVFSGAWYRAFTKVYDLMVSKGKDPVSAFKSARDLCFSVLLKAIPISPRVANYYSAVSKCVISTANEAGPEYGKIFSDTFVEWGLVEPTSLKALSSTSWSEVVVNLKRGDKVVKTKSGGAIVSMRKNVSAKISETPIAAAMSSSPDLEVELPGDCFYEFDPSGKLVDEILPDREELLKSSSVCIQQALSDGMWEQKQGKLVRKLIR